MAWSPKPSSEVGGQGVPTEVLSHLLTLRMISLSE